MSGFREIVDFIKLEHTVFDLPFVFSGAVLASGTSYDALKFLLIFIATTTARATGMSVNRILGRKYDLKNPRKREWALVKGTFSMSKAITISIVSAAIFEISAYLLNTFVFILSPIVLLLFIVDPYLKRVTPWRHLFMGSTIGVGVLAGYLSIIPQFPTTWPLYLIFMASSFWIAGFDMIYVIPDVEYDKINGLKTVMTRYGVKNGLRISIAMHAITFASLLALAFFIRSIYYYAALIPILILIIYQHVIVKPDDPKSIRMSFLGANSFIGLIFIAGLLTSLNF